jgi:TPR repeat protein
MVFEQSRNQASHRRPCGNRIFAAAIFWTAVLFWLNGAMAQSDLPSEQDGFARSYMRLGQMYIEGKAVQRDLEKGLFYIRRAEQAGSDEARLALSILPYKFAETGLKKTDALARLQDMAAEGQISALLFLADVQAGSYGDEPDWTQALASLGIAADRGSVEAMLKIGYYYRRGEVVSYDAQQAVTAFKRAEAAGSRTASQELAIFQAYGEGMDPDAAAAISRLKAAKAAGRISALVTEGDLKLKTGTPKIEVDGAIAAWTEAASAGRTDAMLRLGDFYYNGYFGRRQLKKAFAYYRAAADAGDPFGQLALAKAQLAQAQTAKAGIEQLEGLAKSGIDEAGVAVANAYLRGTGVRKDVQAGLRRLQDMAESGSIVARLRLVEIYRSGLRDGYGQLVRTDKAKAASLLKPLLPSLGVSLRLYHELLLSSAMGRLRNPDDLARKLDDLPLSLRHRFFKDLRADVPDLYFDLLRSKLADAGYLEVDTVGWKPTIRAMMSYCRSRGVEKVCASGPFAPQTAEMLSALL